MRRRQMSLATQILALHLAVVTVVLVVGGALTLFRTRAVLDEQYGKRCLAIAESVAASPQIVDAFDDRDPAATIQPIAEDVRRATGATFVVVANADQVRYSHPDPDEVGEKLSTDATATLAGQDYVGVQTGTLGTSVRAKVPLRADDGRVIGVVSVGILEGRVSAAAWRTVGTLAAFLALVAGVGVVGSMLVARRVKRQTFGLEPEAIGRLVEQREAMLHGIREGVVATNADGRVSLVNDEARRLLDLPEDAVGRLVDQLGLPGRLADVLGGRATEPDEVVLRRGRLLLLNWMPADVRDERVGAIVTLRDRTELDALTRELRGVRSASEGLRAKAHEFSNQMHTVAGLIELGEHEEALRYITETSAAHHRVAERVADHVGEPAVSALLIAKAAEATERGLDLRITDGTDLEAGLVDPRDLVTVVGNLVDNALDALGSGPGWVEVDVRTTTGADEDGDVADGVTEGVRVQVRDSGPGIEPGLAQEVFEHGFTTKVARTGGTRGLGLALTRQACVARGGWVSVRNDRGAVFTAWLPVVVQVPAGRDAGA